MGLGSGPGGKREVFGEVDDGVVERLGDADWALAAGSVVVEGAVIGGYGVEVCQVRWLAGGIGAVW